MKLFSSNVHIPLHSVTKKNESDKYTELSVEVQRMRAEFRSEIQKMRAEFRTENESMRIEFHTENGRMRAEVDQKQEAILTNTIDILNYNTLKHLTTEYGASL